MIVTDTSAIIAFLTDSTAQRQKVAKRLEGEERYAPAHLDFEAAKVIRRLLTPPSLTLRLAQIPVS